MTAYGADDPLGIRSTGGGRRSQFREVSLTFAVDGEARGQAAPSL